MGLDGGVRVAVLGPVTVTTADGVVVPLPGVHTRSLVAALAVGGAAVHNAEALIDDIWADSPPRNPRAALQTLVSRVRATAGADLVHSDPSGYSLGVPPDAVDLERARRLVEAASHAGEGDPARLTLVDEALALWRGEPGDDLAGTELAGVVTDAASAVRDRAQALRAGALVTAGRTGEAALLLAAMAAARPYDETLHADLMTALAAEGRSQDALAVFADLRSRLRDDLGTSPGDAVTSINTRLLRGDAATAPRRLRIGLRAAHNPLLGRDQDVAAIPALLARHRLVTILGAGGLGKTRLAQAVAAASDAPAVVFVELASVRADDDVAPAIASALGLSEAAPGGRLADALNRPDLRSRVIASLGERPTLVVLDNCEQVIDAVAMWAADMLGAVPALRILATSRTPLTVGAEAVYPLAALRSAADDADEVGPAAQLFLDRARAVRPDAVLPLDVVVRLCDRLDGLPLAIELAAARVRSMTPDQIEARLRDRFALLTTGDRTAPERHRTLQAVIEWSWDLLDGDARSALATLSLLPAGFTAPTAAAVLGIPFADDLLDRLVSQSLLIVADDPEGGGLRFRMLETVREFGQSRLLTPGDEQAAWDAILRWAHGFAAERVDHVLEPAAHRELVGEHDNLLSVLRYAVDHDRAAETVTLSAVLGQMWIVRGSFSELVTFARAGLRLEPLATDADLSVDARAVALILGAIAVQFSGGGTGTARALARLRILLRRGGLSDRWSAFAEAVTAGADQRRFLRVLEELRTSDSLDRALIGELLAAQYAENEGDAQSAMVAARRAWEIADETGDVWVAATAASTAATLASQSARPLEALEWLDRSVAGFQAFGAEDELRQQAWIRGSNLVSLGRLDEARELFGELATMRDRTDDGLQLASIGWFGLAETDRASGDSASAAERYEYALEQFATNDQRESPWFLMAMAGLVAATSFDSSLPTERIERWASRLRTRAIALHRMRPEFVDKPVVGTVLGGWSAWAMTQPEHYRRGLESLALATLLGARQDLPSLHLDEHIAHADRIGGAGSYAKALAAASALPVDERVDRAFALLTMAR